MKNPFSLKEKTTGQILNNFTIIKSITLYFLHSLCVSKAATLCVSSLALFSKAATLYSLFLNYLLEGYNTLHSPPLLSSQRQQYLTLSFLLCSSQAKIPFFSLGFMLYFSSPQIEDLWTKAKANKFFVALSIYKTFSYSLF